MAPNTGFTKRSDPLYSFYPASKEHVESKRVTSLTMVEVDCQSFSGVPLKKKKNTGT